MTEHYIEKCSVQSFTDVNTPTAFLQKTKSKKQTTTTTKTKRRTTKTKIPMTKTATLTTKPPLISETIIATTATPSHFVGISYYFVASFISNFIFN